MSLADIGVPGLSYFTGYDNALHVATLLGDVAAVDRIKTRVGSWQYDITGDPLMLCPHIDTRTAEGTTSLHIAAAFDHVAVAAKLLEKGADANASDKYGNTPLIAAVQSGHADMAMLLLKQRGIDKEKRNFFENSALATAAYCGQLGCVMLLLDVGCSATATGRSKTTALHCAAYTGRLDIVKELLSRGVKDSKDIHGLTARALAEIKDHTDIMAVLTYTAKSFVEAEHEAPPTKEEAQAQDQAEAAAHPRGLLGNMRRPMKAGMSGVPPYDADGLEGVKA